MAVLAIAKDLDIAGGSSFGRGICRVMEEPEKTPEEERLEEKDEDMLLDNLELSSLDTYNHYLGTEKERIENIATKFKELSDLVCTGCGYCMPCPNEVNIKLVFEYMIRYQIYGQEEAKTWYNNIGKVSWAPGKNASACVECGECLEKCPQSIQIIEQLKKAHEVLCS